VQRGQVVRGQSEHENAEEVPVRVIDALGHLDHDTAGHTADHRLADVHRRIDQSEVDLNGFKIGQVDRARPGFDRGGDDLPIRVHQRHEHGRTRQGRQFLGPAIEPEAGGIGADFPRGQVHGGIDGAERVVDLLAERGAEIADG